MTRSRTRVYRVCRSDSRVSTTPTAPRAGSRDVSDPEERTPTISDAVGLRICFGG